jgi:hypothetical protein
MDASKVIKAIAFDAIFSDCNVIIEPLRPN